MVIAIGSDHAGYHLKEHVKGVLLASGHEVVDVGTGTPDSVDYPAFAEQAARLVGGASAPGGRGSAPRARPPGPPSPPPPARSGPRAWAAPARPSARSSPAAR